MEDGPHFPEVCYFPLDDGVGGAEFDMVEGEIALQEAFGDLFSFQHLDIVDVGQGWQSLFFGSSDENV